MQSSPAAVHTFWSGVSLYPGTEHGFQLILPRLGYVLRIWKSAPCALPTPLPDASHAPRVIHGKESLLTSQGKITQAPCGGHPGIGQGGCAPQRSSEPCGGLAAVLPPRSATSEAAPRIHAPRHSHPDHRFTPSLECGLQAWTCS